MVKEHRDRRIDDLFPFFAPGRRQASHQLWPKREAAEQPLELFRGVLRVVDRQLSRFARRPDPLGESEIEPVVLPDRLAGQVGRIEEPGVRNCWIAASRIEPRSAVKRTGRGEGSRVTSITLAKNGTPATTAR